MQEANEQQAVEPRCATTGLRKVKPMMLFTVGSTFLEGMKFNVVGVAMEDEA
ncbi:hypothetical protein Gotri_027796 [Gossypium trilobum]|uniref:Uncharacterized protein n=1 Tax=Gossypium trilobum TaxID=34281 RepID=A0A7J9FMR8_9ROSI|nr:hypothetical protein [Gossypium trilobum]